MTFGQIEGDICTQARLIDESLSQPSLGAGSRLYKRAIEPKGVWVCFSCAKATQGGALSKLNGNGHLYLYQMVRLWCHMWWGQGMV